MVITILFIHKKSVHVELETYIPALPENDETNKLNQFWIKAAEKIGCKLKPIKRGGLSRAVQC